MMDATSSGLAVGGDLDARALAGVGFRPVTRHVIECHDENGDLKWREEIENLTTNVGLNDMLDKYWKGSAYTAAFFVGLKGAGTIAAGDTMASHAGWSEIAAYSNANRPALTLGSVASQAVDNSASKAVFNINGTATIAGAFVTTNNTISGTTGTLVGASDFGSSRAVVAGDTLSCTISLTAATA